MCVAKRDTTNLGLTPTRVQSGTNHKSSPHSTTVENTSGLAVGRDCCENLKAMLKAKLCSLGEVVLIPIRVLTDTTPQVKLASAAKRNDHAESRFGCKILTHVHVYWNTRVSEGFNQHHPDLDKVCFTSGFWSSTQGALAMRVYCVNLYLCRLALHRCWPFLPALCRTRRTRRTSLLTWRRPKVVTGTILDMGLVR